MKTFFTRRSLRERLMLLAFALIAFVWWGAELSVRVPGNLRDWRSATADATVQRLWLEQAGRVGERTAGLALQLDPARTLNAAQAYAEISRLAAGLPVEMGGQRTDRTAGFALHSLQVTFRRSDLASLVKFYTALGARAPYLGIDQCTISADRANPGMVNAMFRVYSVESVSPLD